jgi:hypothetical protein
VPELVSDLQPHKTRDGFHVRRRCRTPAIGIDKLLRTGRAGRPDSEAMCGYMACTAPCCFRRRSLSLEERRQAGVYRVRGLDDGMGTRFLRLFETSLGSSAVLARTIHGDAHGAPPGLNTQERLMSPARLYYTT